jgi:hypothetical protein
METVACESVSTIVTVSMTATVPTMAMARSTLGVMSLSPEVGSIRATYQSHSGMATPRKHQASDWTSLNGYSY